jgi:hypothetical protein
MLLQPLAQHGSVHVPNLLEGSQTGFPRALSLRPLTLEHSYISLFPEEMRLHVMNRTLQNIGKGVRALLP